MRWWVVTFVVFAMGCGGEDPPELQNLQCNAEGGACPANLCCGTGDDGMMDCYLQRTDGDFWLCNGSDCTQATVDMACDACDVCP